MRTARGALVSPPSSSPSFLALRFFFYKKLQKVVLAAEFCGLQDGVGG